MSELLNKLLAKPVGQKPLPRQSKDSDFTRKVEIKGDLAEVEVRGPVGDIDESAAAAYLRSKGENPDDWEATGFRSSDWTMPNGAAGESIRYTFVRRTGAARANIDELLRMIDEKPLPEVPQVWVRKDGDAHTFIVALGDTQFGKLDGDGPNGTLTRVLAALDKAAELLAVYRLRFNITHVHIAWLGDHIEGFLSQGGANVWRTVLTLSEQIRLTRRVMTYAMLLFAPLCDRLTMAAVPGNHGETARFAGKGVTRYDDSHDTEALIAVADAAELNPERFGHVEFFVPETDEMVVVVDCSGTVVAHAHGHQFRPGKHFDWWRGQAFNKDSGMHMADLLLIGHLHHEFIESDGPRTAIQVPSFESESTWYKHSTGTGGAPGLIVAVTAGGVTNLKEVVR